MSPVNPFDKVKQYRTMAAVHSNQFWSEYLREAAELLEVLATDNLRYINEKPVQQSNAGLHVSPDTSLHVSGETWPIEAKRPKAAPVTRARRPLPEPDPPAAAPEQSRVKGRRVLVEPQPIARRKVPS